MSDDDLGSADPNDDYWPGVQVGAGTADCRWVETWLYLPDALAQVKHPLYEEWEWDEDPHWEQVTFIGHSKKNVLVRTHGRWPAKELAGREIVYSSHGDYHFQRHELLYFTDTPREKP